MTSGADSSRPANGICRTKLLTDEPGSSDDFGPHNRVAKSITNLIIDPEEKGVTIGVEGSWGAGKTTVINLLRKELEKDEKNVSLVQFDAWAHEGDPLRRAFIENIVRHLQQKTDWLDAANWKKRLEEIANKRVVTDTKDIPLLGFWEKAIILSLLLIPGGGAFIAAALREEVTLNDTGVRAWKFILLISTGVALSVVPALVLLVNRVLHRFNLSKRADIWSVLFNKGATNKRTITSKTPETTSIEFEETFTALMEEALKGDGRRLVLVLDNLDRVDSKDALSIWSTLQTFLQHRQDVSQPWQRRLWIVVPYDPTGLRALWEAGDEAAAKDQVASSFIDKSFQVRFEVPAPVLSDWRAFLVERLKDAFQDHSEQDWHQVYRVLAIDLAKRNRPPTIRELKLFINQIGSIHRQWAKGSGELKEDALPLPHIAYYVLLRREGEDILGGLLNNTLPTPDYRALLGESAGISLAAMFYNVKADEAQQLLISGKIREALERGSSSAISELAAIPKGFWEALEHYITTEWSGSEAVKIADAAFALGESRLLEKAPHPAARNITRSFCSLTEAVELWSPFDESKARGLSVVMEWQRGLATDTDDYTAFVNRIFWAVGLGFKREASRDTSLDVRTWTELLLLSVKDLQPGPRRAAYERVVEAIAFGFKEDRPVQDRVFEWTLEALSELRTHSDGSFPAKSVLEELANGGHVTSQLLEIRQRPPAVTAWCLYTLFRYASNDQVLSQIRHNDVIQNSSLAGVFSNSDQPLIEKFTEIVLRYKQLPLLFEVASAAPEVKAFVVSALREALKSEGAVDMFTAEGGVDRLEFVVRELGQSDDEVANLKKIINYLENAIGVSQQVRGKEFEAKNAKLYDLILQVTQDWSGSFAGWCVKGVESTTGGEWGEQLRGRGELINLAFALVGGGWQVDLGQPFLSALSRLAVDIVEGKSVDVPSAVRGKDITALLGDHKGVHTDDLQRRLHGLMLPAEGDVPGAFFELYGEVLSRRIISEPSGLELLNVFLHFARRRNVPGLKWILSTVSSAAEEKRKEFLLSNHFKSFRSEIQKIVDRGDTDPTVTGEAHAAALGIANVLGIKPTFEGLIAFSKWVGNGWEIFVMEGNGSNQRRLTHYVGKSQGPIPTQSNQPAWSPDGRKIAFTTTVHGRFEIYTMDADGQNQLRLTDHPEGCSQPAWSPDGKTIAFIAGGGPQGDIHLIDLGSKQVRRLTQDSNQNEHPTWSPDGKQIAFHSVGAGGPFRIKIINIDGTGLRELTDDDANNIHPAWSPDGTRIAFVSQKPNGTGGIYVMSPDGGPQIQITSDIDSSNPSWGPSGERIVFQNGGGVKGRLYVVSAAGGEELMLTRDSEGNMEPSWQPTPYSP
jgi:tol-pal system beta propeller repeat protein TolB